MRILILGCGWLGESFAIDMLQQGHEVWASTTQEEKYHRLKTEGIFSFIADFDKPLDRIDTRLPDQYDLVLNSVPASKKNSLAVLEDRFAAIQLFLQKIRWTKLIYLSSIGIYPDRDGVFDESFTAKDALSDQLLLAEDLMLQLPHSYVFRLAGLFGKGRIFAKYFANRICTTGEQPANFVHLDDVVRLIALAAGRDLSHRVYNVVTPMHPKKKEVIRASAEKYGFALPERFEAGDDVQKIVDGSLLQDELDYHFIKPNPIDF